MDLTIIATFISIISVVMSVVTLLLTEFRGPDIKRISEPKFEVDYCGINAKRREKERQGSWILHVDPSLDLKVEPLVFANHGGRAGTILNLKIEFCPTTEFNKYYKIFHSKLDISGKNPDLNTLCMPSTIERGDNKIFDVSANILTIDWKRASLTENLDSSGHIKQIIEKATLESKKKYESYCDLLENTKSIGTISCTWIYTKGRFKTKVVTEKLFTEVPVTMSNIANTSLREILKEWNDAIPSKDNLVGEMTHSFEAIIKELSKNKLLLRSEVDSQNLNELSSLTTDSWRQLCCNSEAYFKPINWFIIKSEKNLEAELDEIFTEIELYKRYYSEIQSRRDFITKIDLKSINSERIKLKGKIEKAEIKLIEIQHRRIQ